ncbi:MAG: S8 family serine peptidase, partial [Gemmatimonadota bacterium]
WVLDLVFSTSNSSPFSYAWTAGTSMASPAVAGVAALIVSKNGGQMSPARVEAALRKAVNFDDGGAEGQNGRTAFFGRGQVSALEALR